MKALNAKRIAAVAVGATLLGFGLAYAGSVTFQNVPIINNAGTPVVQIVIGSSAKPSDGVAAANIAAAIGNLAFTTVPVSASVNATQAASVLHVAVSNPSYSLSNQQVWLNESASSYGGAGTYGFAALIGSVLNRGITLGAPQNTKSLAGSSYAYQVGSAGIISTSASPPYSAFSAAGFVPTSTSVSASNNGGGVTFTSFTNQSTSTHYDNILQVTSTQLPGLLSNSGANGETESLWLTGFPVYDQNTGVSNFAIIDANGAYEATFNKPISVVASGGSALSGNSYVVEGVNNAGFSLLGQSWTIVGATVPAPVSTLTTTQAVAGGALQLAQSLNPLTTVYVGQNVTSGNFKVVLTDLGQANSNGISPASLSVYYKGVLTNSSSNNPGTLAQYNVSGQKLYVKVNQTFAGLYAYSKWAKLQLYSNVFNITNGHVFNQTYDPNWYTNILWTNTTSTGGHLNQLYGIVLYGTSSNSQTLTPGQSFSFITSPAMWKVSFVGDTLGSAQFDPVTASLVSTGSVNYENTGYATTVAKGLNNINNITEPAQELVLTSSIPNAFQATAGPSSSTVTYDLTPYTLTEVANTIYGMGTAGSGTGHPFVSAGDAAVPTNSVVTLVAATVGGNFISTTNPLTLTITGYSSNTATSPVSTSVTFTGGPSGAGETANTQVQASPQVFFNVTGIQIQQRAIPGGVTVNVYSGNNLNANVMLSSTGVQTSNVVQLATLAPASDPVILYTQPGVTYLYETSPTSAGGSNVIYNQQNGQPTSLFQLTQTSQSGSGAPAVSTKFYTYSMSENPVPGISSTSDSLGFEIVNSTSGVAATPAFNLNVSLGGTKNNMSYTASTYTNTGSSYVNAPQGFRTERGSVVASIQPTTATVKFATSVDELALVIGPTNSTATGKSAKLYGPYGVGQATNIANVSIAKVNATIKLGSGGSSSYTITGVDNITATPSVTMATVPVLLKNLSTTAPLVVLDSAANPADNLILVGSGYVNTLSQQVQQVSNVTVVPGATPIVQAFGTNRILVAGYAAADTTAAANSFIQDLYANAAST
jgi:hypothetical protein